MSSATFDSLKADVALLESKVKTLSDDNAAKDKQIIDLTALAQNKGATDEELAALDAEVKAALNPPADPGTLADPIVPPAV